MRLTKVLSCFFTYPSSAALPLLSWVGLNPSNSAPITRNTRSRLHSLSHLFFLSLLATLVRFMPIFHSKYNAHIGFSAVDKYDLSSVRIIFSGAAPLGAALTKQVTSYLVGIFGTLADGKIRSQTDYCPNARRKIRSTSFKVLIFIQPLLNTRYWIVSLGFGLTETSPVTHIQPTAHGFRKLGSVGLLLPNLEARLVTDLDGQSDAKEGEQGELWIRGPSVMKVRELRRKNVGFVYMNSIM